jgi:hypothetical protein
MWISNSSSFTPGTGTGWIPFQSTYPWTLGTTSGETAVYAEFGSSSTSVGNAVANITVGSGGMTEMTGVTPTTVMTNGGGALSTAQGQLLNLLISELKTLLAQAQAQGIALPPGAATFLNAGSMSSALSAGTQDLTVGSNSSSVSALQSFLIAQGKGPAASALAAVGATGYFGSLTQAALAEYQQAVGITPAAGYFGPKTRAYLQGIGY